MGGKLFSNKGKYSLYSKVFLIFLIMTFAVSALERSSINDINTSDSQTEQISVTETSNESSSEIVSETSAEEPNLTLIEEELNESAIGTIEEEPEIILLAEEVNGISIEDSYIQEYLELRNDFEDLLFAYLSDGSLSMKEGNSITEEVKGYIIDGRKYAIHLILCDEEFRGCYFRINGVPTGRLISQDDSRSEGERSFVLDNNYTMDIKSIRFNDCGTRRFCDVYWNEENIVELSITNKGVT